MPKIKPPNVDNEYPVETVPLTSLRPHPRNYRQHPEDQIAHIMKSLTDNGFYRNIVIAKDDVILAGHGVYEAARRLGLKEIPVRRLPINSGSTAALKILAGDNELPRLAASDDRALSEILRTIKDEDIDGLLGTGYDDMMLANLVFITRPASEIKDFDAAAHWAGMPEFQGGAEEVRFYILFDSNADLDRFLVKFGKEIELRHREGVRFGIWPPKGRIDARSVRFEGLEEAAAPPPKKASAGKKAKAKRK